MKYGTLPIKTLGTWGPRRHLWSRMHFPVHRLGCHQWHPRVLVGMDNLRLWHHHKTESRTPKKSRVKKSASDVKQQKGMVCGCVRWLWAVWVIIDSMQGVERIQVSNEFSRSDDACSTTTSFNILKAARPYSFGGPPFARFPWLLGMRCIPCFKCCIPGIFQSTNIVTIHNRTRYNVSWCI